jgi:C-terminal processing protease CtpA/Prc
VFDTYADALAAEYPFFGRKGVDWEALRDQYRSAVTSTEAQAEFYHLLTGMLAELRDPHVSLRVPRANWAEDGVAATSLGDVDGLVTFVVEERLYVSRWPDGEAPTPPDHLAGSARGEMPQIVRLEGVPVIWPLANNLLVGRPSSPAELTLRWSDGTLSRHTMVRPAAPPPELTAITLQIEGRSFEAKLEPIPMVASLQNAASLEMDGSIARLRVNTLLAEAAGVETDAFLAHLDELVDQSLSSDGLILDLRSNHGGSYHITAALAGRFLTRPYRQVFPPEVSSFAGMIRVTTFRQAQWPPREPIFDGPIVVLTSWQTGSGAEQLARVLQTERGALVVGERTRGAEAVIREVEGPDGSQLLFGSRRLLDSRGRGIQDEGVLPDVAVVLRLADVIRLESYEAARADWDERVLRAARDALTRR